MDFFLSTMCNILKYLVALAYSAIENDLVTGLDFESGSFFPAFWTQVSLHPNLLILSHQS